MTFRGVVGQLSRCGSVANPLEMLKLRRNRLVTVLIRNH